MVLSVIWFKSLTKHFVEHIVGSQVVPAALARGGVPALTIAPADMPTPAAAHDRHSCSPAVASAIAGTRRRSHHPCSPVVIARTHRRASHRTRPLSTLAPPLAPTCRAHRPCTPAVHSRLPLAPAGRAHRPCSPTVRVRPPSRPPSTPTRCSHSPAVALTHCLCSPASRPPVSFAEEEREGTRRKGADRFHAIVF